MIVTRNLPGHSHDRCGPQPASAPADVESVVVETNLKMRFDTRLSAAESLQQLCPPRRAPENGADALALLEYSNGRARLSTRNTYQAALRSRTVKVSPFRVFARLVRILWHLGFFWTGVVVHRLSGKELEERQRLDAIRFRDAIQKLGGVLIKVGQQMSQRPDMLPPAYCDALQHFLHDIDEPIPKAHVKEVIRSQTGKSVDELFADFKWDHIGSASVACVYKAVLHSGEVVAVKVLRPGIKKQFTADLTALEWLLKLSELLTIWRPGMSRNFRGELKDLLFEELDFRREARNQELFRRYHKRRKKLNVTAPKVYHKYSGEELMVSEFVTGIKVQDIIDAKDFGNQECLDALEEQGIDPKRLAKQLARSRYYSFHECPLFHGDPHPGNILVLPNNKIVMIDFGACGVFSERDRNLMWQLNQYYAREDVGGMVNMVIAIMEPIDPVRGVHQFRKELLDAWWAGFYGIKSKHADWWERSSFRLWLKYFELIRKYQIPMPRNMVRMIRATLLYDTVCARLYPEVNVFDEFQKYSEDVAKRARRHIEECAIRQLLLGPDDRNFLKAQQVVDVANGVLHRVQKYLDDPGFNFAEVAGKVYSAVRAFVRMFLLIGAAILLASGMTGVVSLTGNLPPLNSWKPWEWMPDHYSYSVRFVQMIISLCLLYTLVMVVAYGRRVYLRFGDIDD